jgi:hypothetical protein
VVDVKKRWRAWLRAIHRDFGYLAIGFTVIYAISGIAQNHIEDWGDVSYVATERTLTIAAIPDSVPDADAVARVADAAGLGAPTSSLRAGDEIRLDYSNGSRVTAIGTQVTVQHRERRAFIGLANWLHTARGKKAWKYISDAYAVLLLYLACSGIFMIKGRLGLKWRGTVLISTGIAVPVLYIALAGGPNSQHTKAPEDSGELAARPHRRPLPPDDETSGSASATSAPASGSASGAAPGSATGSAMTTLPTDNPHIKPLPPDEN